ncbi:MAG: GLPGLI family protein [Bacteroidota bacterium]
MKTTILVLAGIAMFQVAAAQNDGKKITSGTVRYEEKVKLDIHLEGDGAQFSNMLPKERKSNKILVFNQDAALYTNNKDVAEEEDIMSDVEGGGMIQVHMEEPDNRLFTDLKTKKQIEQREFMTRMFLIEGEMETSPWKLTGNAREILGYTCQEAVLEKDSVKTVAWFTPSIPVSAGPGLYNNLPGLVLEVNVKDGDRIITATSVEETTGDIARLEKPKEGKKVTKEEFNRIVEEKRKEMGIEEGVSGDGATSHVIMRISRNPE